MELFQAREFFSLEEIGRAIGKDKWGAKKMLEDAGCRTNLRMLGVKVPVKEIHRLRGLLAGNYELCKKLDLLTMQVENQK